jgi:GT2 family glycosyltransferase
MIIVIPTRNRINKLLNTLNYLQNNKFFFKKIIIVDSSDMYLKKTLKEKILNYHLNIRIIDSKPSTCIQRNIGFNYINNEKFVMFLDDDINFFSNAFKKMHTYLKNINNNIVGISFNLITKTNFNFIDSIKKNYIFDKIGFYKKGSGMISRSGWQTIFGNFKKNEIIEWMPTGAAIYRVNAIKKIRFEEKFGVYGYLEDLDFSLKLRKKGSLMVCSEAKFTHDVCEDRSSFNFGKKEFLNRYFIVKKYNFNKILFFIVFFLRVILTFITALSGNANYLKRFLGNLHALFNYNKLNHKTNKTL